MYKTISIHCRKIVTFHPKPVPVEVVSSAHVRRSARWFQLHKARCIRPETLSQESHVLLYMKHWENYATNIWRCIHTHHFSYILYHLPDLFDLIGSCCFTQASQNQQGNIESEDSSKWIMMMSMRNTGWYEQLRQLLHFDLADMLHCSNTSNCSFEEELG